MINTSLSARIKRRNAAGFKGEGSHKRFDDPTIMPNINDPAYNCKDTHSNRSHKAAVTRAKHNYIRHAYSKLQHILDLYK